MYPSVPTLVLPLTGDLARTGMPLAAFLIAATSCLLLGLLSLRASVMVKASQARRAS